MSGPAIEPGGSGDFRYYERPFNYGFVWRLAHGPRKRMYEAFVSALAPKESDRVLDLGVSHLPEPLENMFEVYYPHTARITAAGVEDASFLEERHPGLRFVRLDGSGRLPFQDDEFDIGFSSAVIEHVGTREQQRMFLSELVRVSRRAFLTTPNRWFPVELHTRLPFLHWLPRPLHRRALRALGLDFYAREENLHLLGPGELRELLPPGVKARLSYNWFLGLPSNLMLVIEKRARA